jgi:hypothetical protein
MSICSLGGIAVNVVSVGRDLSSVEFPIGQELKDATEDLPFCFSTRVFF